MRAVTINSEFSLPRLNGVIVGVGNPDSICIIFPSLTPGSLSRFFRARDILYVEGDGTDTCGRLLYRAF